MKNTHWEYLLGLPALLFIMFGMVKIYTLHRDNGSIRSSLQVNQSNLSSLKDTEQRTNLKDYDNDISKNGTNLYKGLPELDNRIQHTLLPIYTKINDTTDYNRMASQIKKSSPGSLASTALQNAKPQPVQGQKKELSPYASIKNIKIDSKYSNYDQGNIIILSDVTYTDPRQIVSGNNSIKLPSYIQHDYYLSSYNFNTKRLDSITITHSQSKGGQ